MDTNYQLSSKLSPLEYDVLRKLRADIENGQCDMRISAFSGRNYVSASFLIKMSKKLGHTGYKEMIFQMKQDLKNKKTGVSDIDLQSYKQVIDNYTDELSEKFVDSFRRCQNEIISVLGIQYSGIVGDYICRKINSRGYASHNGNPMDVEMLKKDGNAQLFITISRSGEHQHIYRILEQVIPLGYYTIAFTADSNSRIANICHLPIIVSSSCQGFSDQDINLFTGRAITAFELLFCKI